MVFEGKKSFMKRLVSLLLTAVLLTVTCQPAAAQGDTSPQPASVRAKETGQIDVSIIPALSLCSPTEFTVSLTGQKPRTVVLEPDEGAQFPQNAETSFDGLAPDNYTLEVTAPGFAGYRQEIKTEAKNAYRVKLTTGFVSGYNYEKGSLHPGVLLIGDVNGDGQIDEQDRKLMTDAVNESDEKNSGNEMAAGPSESAGSASDTENGTMQTPDAEPDAGSGSADGSESEIKPTDLNRDGKTDLADLEYFTKGYEETRRAESSIEKSIPASMITARVSDSNTVVNGELEELLKCGNSVSLSRADKADISKENPVSAEFVIEDGTAGGIVIETGTDNPVRSAEIGVVTDKSDGEPVWIQVPGTSDTRSLRQVQVQDTTVNKSASGTISIDFGKRVAVKRVVLRITGLEKTGSLAEIAKVTFIGDMKDRIPEPETDIPANLKAAAGSASFTLDWDACENITGYEVSIRQLDAESEEDGKEQVIQVTGNTLSVMSLTDTKKVENYKKYEAKVCSVNGLWRSGYSKAVTVEPKPSKLPDAPDYVTAKGQYKALQVSWKMMKDSETFNLYYKRADETSFTKIEGIAENTYTVTGLGERVKYEVYITGVNHIGEGRPSLTASAVTKSIELAKVPKYKMINKAAGGEVSPHITSASTGSGGMQDSVKDTQTGTAWGSVDNNAASYYLLNSWDSGGFNPLGKGGLFFEFDQAYKMQMITLQEPVEQDLSYAYAQIRYWDADGKETLLDRSQVSVRKKTDEEGRAYYMLRLQQPVTAKKIQIGLARSLAKGTIAVSEVYFYHYDPLEDDIMGLYTDDLHTVLRSDVTMQTISELRNRVNTKESESGEYHPDREMLLRELQTAEDILNSALHEPVRIHSTITTKDTNRGFGGLNAWQPLGVTAAAGEEITVYAGHSQKRTGDRTDLQLVATQYHSEANAMFKVIATLKIGRNDITIPQISSFDAERGGALYVQYTNERANDDYAVRVNGGVQVPVLDLYQVTDQSVRRQRITDYLSDLNTYVSQMQTNHNQLHKSSSNQNVKYDYDERNCILGATDILLDTMMLSIPAQQVLSGSGSSDPAGTLSQSMQAMEDMMYLFYQHKGLNKNAKDPIDKIPAGHQNIRYQRMFAGAFMYASGNHIGIEYPETKGMASGKPVESDADGRHVSGQYFGWGIAHEIGHCINQGAYAVAEITNNYFSVLAQAKDRNDSVRFSYDEVYKKVTSNAKGRASNVFTQLGMYWQLHLAYDKGYNYKTYDSHADQLDGLFFARMDYYARKPARADEKLNKEIKLNLSGDTDQKLMRLSCAAAEKNLLEFFERWGMVPDEDTVKYAEQFEKETRAIYYANDNDRVYQLAGINSALAPDKAGLEGAKAEAGTSDVSITIPLPANASDREKVLGYEIARSVKKPGGKESESQLAGFVTVNGNSGTEIVFKDKLAAMNNRAVTYEVTLIDRFLNRTKTQTIAPVKVSIESYISKTDWTVKANNLTADIAADSGTSSAGGVQDCEDEQKALMQGELQKAIDNDASTYFTGRASESGNAEVILEFNKSHAVTALQYQGSTDGSYEIYVRNMNGIWQSAAAGSFKGEEAEKIPLAKDVNLDQNYSMAYQTDALKLVLSGQSNKIQIHELDVLKVAGDNIEFGIDALDSSGSTVRIEAAKLSADYRYGSDASDIITQGSIVFIGSYRGNPAYNVVRLYDENGNTVGGTDSQNAVNAGQVILADVPEDGPVQNVADGIWIYYIGSEYVNSQLQAGLSGRKIRAELYRVDDAETLEGERLVSDTDYISLPQSLESVTLPSASQGISLAVQEEKSQQTASVSAAGRTEEQPVLTFAAAPSAEQPVLTFAAGRTEEQSVLTFAAAPSAEQLVLEAQDNVITVKLIMPNAADEKLSSLQLSLKTDSGTFSGFKFSSQVTGSSKVAETYSGDDKKTLDV